MLLDLTFLESSDLGVAKSWVSVIFFKKWDENIGEERDHLSIKVVKIEQKVWLPVLHSVEFGLIRFFQNNFKNETGLPQYRKSKQFTHFIIVNSS